MPMTMATNTIVPLRSASIFNGPVNRWQHSTDESSSLRAKRSNLAGPDCFVARPPRNDTISTRPLPPAKPGAREGAGTTLIELLVVLSLFGLVSGAIYTFFQHYASSYVKIDDKLESVTEGWQVMRMLKDDLLFCDSPGGDPALWESTLTRISPGELEIIRRYGDQTGTVTYHFDSRKGDISREERAPGKSPRNLSLLRNRCKTFQVSLNRSPNVVPAGKTPERVYFKVFLELGNVSRPKGTSVPLGIETNIIPIFLNQRLNHGYVHDGYLE